MNVNELPFSGTPRDPSSVENTCGTKTGISSS